MAAHVLVVDDDRLSTELVGQLLRNAGYRVSVAQHFNAALDILDQSPPPDVLITDIVMPSGVNGAALARMARMRNRIIRVIYITGYDIPNIDRETFGPVLRKPLADDLLLATVAAELSAKDADTASNQFR
jgi:CheY-like chemotaxis protein